MRVYNSEIEKIKKKIKFMAEQFGLKYKEQLYKVCFLTKLEITVLNFLTGCPEPRYAKFGGKIRERIKKINEFLHSKEFEKLSKERGGCVVTIKTFQDSIKKMKGGKTRNVCRGILQKLKAAGFEKNAIVVTIPETEREKRFVFNTIIFHEWIHTLLIFNKINFQRIRKDYWKLDEGLVEYTQTFFKAKSSDVSEILNQKIRTNRNAFYMNYLKNAVKFNAILKNKKTPSERKNAILNYYNKLKK